ncbi:MAG: hypothetical protein FWC40_08735, partial [Proteobacteria bacterium]|nr:hypothetical protein [Pseudomonadota bacterium]
VVPVLHSVSPDAGAPGQQVYFSGENVKLNMSVCFGKKCQKINSVQDSAHTYGTVPEGCSGYVDVSIKAGKNESILPGGFYCQDPGNPGDGPIRLTAVVPASGKPGDAVNFVGQNIKTGMSTCFGDTCREIWSVDMMNDPERKAMAFVPEGCSGYVDVSIRSGENQSVLKGSFLCQGGGDSSAPSLLSPPMEPTSGAAGDPIAIRGKNLEKTTKVCFGTVCAEGDDIIKPNEFFQFEDAIMVIVPAGSGSVAVMVHVEGHAPLNAGTFTYTAGGVGALTMEPSSGVAGDPIAIGGKNLESTTKVCFGAVCVEGDSIIKPDDVFSFEDAIIVIVPEGSGSVVVMVHADGTEPRSAGTFTYTKVNTIDWCRFNYVQRTAFTNEPFNAYVEVYKNGCTPNSDTRCRELRAEVGYSSLLTSDPSRYTWRRATRNAQFGGESAANNDEYMAALTLSTGNYNLAARFTMDDGKHWVYCDREGSAKSLAEAGQIPVDVGTNPSFIWGDEVTCGIINPKSYTASAGNTQRIMMEIYIHGCTGKQGDNKDCEMITGALLRYAPTGTPPPYSGWASAAVGKSSVSASSENNELFGTDLIIYGAGTYHYFFEFELRRRPGLAPQKVYCFVDWSPLPNYGVATIR